MLRRNYLLKRVIERKIEGSIVVAGRRGRRRKQILDDVKGKNMVLDIERGSTRSQSVENSFWKRLWTCRKADYRMMMMMMMMMTIMTMMMMMVVIHEA